MFSVIIPLYNKENYIEKCISSVLHQTFQEFELIIINDGSTDGSVEKVVKFKDKRIKIINQTNTGVSLARNNGVKEAIYNYIAFLDADDWWCDSFLESIQIIIKAYSDAVIFSSSYYLVKNNKLHNTKIGLDRTIDQGYINYIELYAKYLCMPIFPSSVVIRKSTFREYNGFKKNLKVGEDFDLWMRIALNNKIALINKPLVYYNQDVEISNRGVSRKLHKKEAYFTFNLTYLAEEESKNLILKKLLDNIKVTSLEHYYVNRLYVEEVNNIISKVDFGNVPKKIALTYTLPFLIAKIRYLLYKWIYDFKLIYIHKFKKI